MQTIKRVFKPAQGSYFLFGPRGTGKSTWLHQNVDNSLWIDLLDAEQERAYSAKPERLREIVTGSKKTHIIIDEIQKIPELLSTVHNLIESKQGLKFIMTGSSSSKLKRTGVNLLGGRATIRNMHPFMAAELNQSFDLEHALRYGLIPLVITNDNPPDVLRAYIGLYLREEVKQEGLVRNIGDFARFLEVMSFSHGSLINISNIARECEISRKIVNGYISILEDLLLGFYLPVFSKKAKRELVKHNKFYYFDTGVFSSLRAQGPLDRSEEINGQALEGMVAQHLRAWNDYSGTINSIFFWRTHTGLEVDFIVYGPNEFCAIEVKNSKFIHPKDLHGLQAFNTDYPQANLVLLYRGNERIKKGNILCLPIEEFLLNLYPEKTLTKTIIEQN